METKKSKAFFFAREKHKGQLDDSGKSYFSAHVTQVGELIEAVTNDETTICAAYLHDTLEDTDTSIQELVENFGWDVANLVLELTHEGSKETGYYFPRLQSKKAILIKFADRLSNLSRMECWDSKRQMKYLKKSKFWKSK